jgi:hypothetical protein
LEGLNDKKLIEFNKTPQSVNKKKFLEFGVDNILHLLPIKHFTANSTDFTDSTSTASIGMANELHEEDDVDQRPLTADNPLVQELINVVLREAQRIVKENTSQFTAEDLFEAAQFWLPGELPRFHKRKQSAWNLALRHEKVFAPADLFKQKAGVRSKGGQGLKGEYQQWFAERWKTEPELRETYERMAAAGASTEGDLRVDEESGSESPCEIC